MAQLTCKNLTLGYDNRAIQEDLNFSIDAGDYLCIVGENGSGKSTLMKTLLHLQAPISGSIELGDGLKKNEIGYLPQQTVVQKDFPATVEEIVLSGTLAKCGWRPFYRKAEKKLAEEKMKRMEVWNLRKSCYRNLSGGQQQRTSIGRAIIKNPSILLCDEPTGALDYHTSKEILKLIEDVNQKYGNTVIMVTHNDAIKNMADRVIRLRDGQIRKNYVNETKIAAGDLDW